MSEVRPSNQSPWWTGAIKAHICPSAWAVERSSFSQMRRLEEVKGRPYGTKELQFVRKGKAGNWVEHFDKRCKEIFKASAGRTLIKLGYAEDMEW